MITDLAIKGHNVNNGTLSITVVAKKREKFTDRFLGLSRV